MKKILIVVDYQNDFVSGSLGFDRAVDLDQKIASRVKQCKEDGYIIMYTLDTHYQNYLQTQEGTLLPIEHCLFNTEGHKLYGETGKILNNIEAIKIIKNSFGSSELSYQLGKVDNPRDDDIINEIELCGLVTNMCVISNAVICKTTCPEAKITINSELCASFNELLHEQALNVMESMQMDVIRKVD